MNEKSNTQSKLPPLPQEYYDENRKRFEADTSATPLENLHKGCNHFFIRKTPSEIGCRNCTNGWIDNGVIVVKEGKISIS